MTSGAERMAATRARRRAAGQPIEDLHTMGLRVARWRMKQRELAREAAAAAAPRPRPRKRRASEAPQAAPAGHPANVLAGTPAPAERRFWGIDGEGCGRDRQGRQRYRLLCMGDDVTRRELFTGKPLTTTQCVEFILSAPAGVILAGFAFGYDVTQILRTQLNPERVKHLFTERMPPEDAPAEERKGLSPYTYWTSPDTGAAFGFNYISGSHFRVCRLRRVRRSAPDGSWTREAIEPVPGSARTVWETFGFFQKKFATALTDFGIGDARERALIARNKAERAEFKRITRGIRRYCAMECALLARMMETLRKACLAVEIKPRQWAGAGRLAAALHQARHTATRREIEAWLPSGVLMFAQAAYYGGRFEIAYHGRVPGPVFEHDIKSAYPANMRELPCLVHGRWRYHDAAGIRRAYDAGALCVATVQFRHEWKRGGGWLCGLPFRSKHGTLSWPIEAQGTYWSPELRSAERLGAGYRWGSGWQYLPECQCRPFDWIEPLYRYRQSLGGSAAGYPIKLAINALYGKLAQRAGARSWTNHVWAGLVTALTRAQLNAAIAPAQPAICMLATDGVYARERLDVPIGGDLGQWELQEHASGLFIVQPGIYWPGDGQPARLKSRGVAKAFFTDGRRTRLFEDAWQRYHERCARQAELDGRLTTLEVADRPMVKLPVRLFTGLALAHARGKPELAGRWSEEPREFKFDWHAKRAWGRWEPGPCVHSYPLPGGPDWISLSHLADAELVNLMDGGDAEFSEQPDVWEWLPQ